MAPPSDPSQLVSDAVLLPPPPLPARRPSSSPLSLQTPHINFDLRVADSPDIMAIPSIPSLVGTGEGQRRFGAATAPPPSEEWPPAPHLHSAVDFAASG